MVFFCAETGDNLLIFIMDGVFGISTCEANRGYGGSHHFKQKCAIAQWWWQHTGGGGFRLPEAPAIQGGQMQAAPSGNFT